MKLPLKTIIILLAVISLAIQSGSVLAAEATITGDGTQEVWTAGIVTISDEVVDSSDARFSLTNEAVITGVVGEVWNYQFGLLDSDATDSSDANFNLSNEALVAGVVDETWTYQPSMAVVPEIDSSAASFAIPNEAQICGVVGASWTNKLDSVEIGDSAVKIPVLFVPGILGTEMFKGETRLWASIEMKIPFDSDSFMDPLQFKQDLTPSDGEVFYGSVISNVYYVNYAKNLIDEFIGVGYVEGKDFFTFPYDWRYGVSGVYPQAFFGSTTTNAILLGNEIERLSKKSPTGKVNIIAHSLGGSVVKKYIIDTVDSKIDKLVFLGVPNLLGA